MGAWEASGSGWTWPERLMRLAGDSEELLEWTEARAPRIVVVRPLVLEAEGSVWEERAAEAADRGRAKLLPRRRSAPGVRRRGEDGDGRSPRTVCFTEAGSEVAPEPSPP